MKKGISILMVPVFVFTMVLSGWTSCTPGQVNTAKDVMGQITFYTSLSRSLISVAEQYYQNNPKVQTALVATKASLLTVESLLVVVKSGIEDKKDELVAAFVVLVQNVFVLMDAIKEAKAAHSP